MSPLIFNDRDCPNVIVLSFQQTLPKVEIDTSKVTSDAQFPIVANSFNRSGPKPPCDLLYKCNSPMHLDSGRLLLPDH